MPPAVVVDSEWGYRDGRLGRESAFEPVVFCARAEGRSFHFLGTEGHRLRRFVDRHRDHRWVAHSVTAEQRYLLRLGIPLPERWWDTMIGHRIENNRPGFLDASLIAALVAAGLSHLIPAEKEEIRDSILHLRFTDTDIPRIIEYCAADVAATAALYEKQVASGRVDPVSMHYWCVYLAAVARMENRGVSIDTPLMRRIWRNRGHVCDLLRRKMNGMIPVYRRDGSFSRKKFFRWVDRAGIRWPVRPSPATGRPYRPLDDDTLEAMEARHQFIGELRKTRKTLRSLGSHPMVVDGPLRRHFYSTMPFRSVTSRNQPRRFLFGMPKWMRFLAVPPSPDHVLIAADYSAQEIGIAAALSSDPAMRAMYESGDPHMTFAVMAGAAPPGATKSSHKAVRDIYKTVSLAVLYSQTEIGISERLGIGEEQALDLLNQHRRLFSNYHAWSDRVVGAAYDRGYATTPAGWRAIVTPGSKWRTWANFPIQGSGADIMRLTTISLDRQGVQVIAIVHDGWLIQCRRDQAKQVEAAIDHARRVACESVLGGFPLRVDVSVHDDRYRDPDGQDDWDYIVSVLPEDWRVESE
jgi:DNA polymerase I-like protein with 3'-5' exonuclease and polymerase domains